MLEYACWLGWSCFRSFMFAPRYCLSVGSLFMKISLKLLNTTILLENIDLHQIKTSEEEKPLFIVVDICFHRWHVWVEVNHLLLLVTSLSWGQHHLLRAPAPDTYLAIKRKYLGLFLLQLTGQTLLESS